MVLECNYILDYTLHSCIIVIHIVTLIFLRRSRCSNRYKNQMIIITCLCICELTGAVLFINYRIFECFISLLVANIILCFALVFAVSIYYFIMVLLTRDRFLAFYLKSKYHFYFTSSKILKLIFAELHASMQIISWFQVENKIFLVYLVFDVGYIFLVIETYSFIFKVYRNQRKFRKTTKSTNKKDSFKLLVPTLIIITLIIHNLIPNIINISYRYNSKSFNETVLKVAFICYRIGWLLDPLIYIFFASSAQHANKEIGKLRSTILKVIDIRKNSKKTFRMGK